MELPLDRPHCRNAKNEWGNVKKEYPGQRVRIRPAKFYIALFIKYTHDLCKEETHIACNSDKLMTTSANNEMTRINYKLLPI